MADQGAGSGAGRPEPGTGRRVYGLAVTGADACVELPPLDSSSADVDCLLPVQIRLTPGPPAAPPVLDGDRIVEQLLTGHWVDLDRTRRTATFSGEPLRPDLITHPYLASTAIGFNRWAGREVLHAGAFVAAGRAWVVLGESTGGKSTLMAALATAGVPVLSDDMVVTDGEAVFAGPRCVDLRNEIPDGVLGWPALPLRRARGDLRWRADLPPITCRVPLGGFFFLEWADEQEVQPVSMSELLGRLAAVRLLRQLPSDPAKILALAARPGWDLRRRQDWSDLSGTIDLLMSVTGAAIGELTAVQR